MDRDYDDDCCDLRAILEQITENRFEYEEDYEKEEHVIELETIQEETLEELEEWAACSEEQIVIDIVLKIASELESGSSSSDSVPVGPTDKVHHGTDAIVDDMRPSPIAATPAAATSIIMGPQVLNSTGELVGWLTPRLQDKPTPSRSIWKIVCKAGRRLLSCSYRWPVYI